MQKRGAGSRRPSSVYPEKIKKTAYQELAYLHYDFGRLHMLLSKCLQWQWINQTTELAWVWEDRIYSKEQLRTLICSIFSYKWQILECLKYKKSMNKIRIKATVSTSKFPNYSVFPLPHKSMISLPIKNFTIYIIIFSSHLPMWPVVQNLLCFYSYNNHTKHSWWNTQIM